MPQIGVPGDAGNGRSNTMQVILTHGDTLVWRVDLDTQEGVPVTFALYLDPEEPDTYNVLSREMDDDEAWQLEWRGNLSGSTKKIHDLVIEATCADLPLNKDEVRKVLEV